MQPHYHIKIEAKTSRDGEQRCHVIEYTTRQVDCAGGIAQARREAVKAALATAALAHPGATVWKRTTVWFAKKVD